MTTEATYGDPATAASRTRAVLDAPERRIIITGDYLVDELFLTYAE